MARKNPADHPGTDGGRQVPARPHDSGSAANETEDGLDASTEALRHATEDTPSGATPDDKLRVRSPALNPVCPARHIRHSSAIRIEKTARHQPAG